MLADINLRFLCQVFQAFFVFVELYDCLGKFVRLIPDEENFFYIRDSLAADGGSDDGGTVIDGFYHLALNPCAVAERYHYNPAVPVQVCQFFFTYKAFDDDAVSRLFQCFDLVGYFGTYDVEVDLDLFPDLREYFFREPEHRVCVRRMRKAADKQESFPFGEVFVQIL